MLVYAESLQHGRHWFSFRTKVSWVVAVLAGIAAGYQFFGSGRDFFSYVSFYENIRVFGEQDFSRFEPGFVLVASFFKLVLNAEVEFLLAVLASASLLIKFAIFSAYRRPFLTILFYLCCWYPLHEYTQIRAAVARSFLWFRSDGFL
ncbi:EpsG-like putative glucosyltransferase [Roseinatronobacter thiooxidans]|uniref:EpsG-like putative glucosyltransferase n=2 Tax=Roseinatronobacter thiooxidans TaxID=121821 RepID=A0A2W7PZ07_9RHOB|nr:EpsG family protein [Roseinatronobacter thiooxidans]PZX40646.1 EpsG-like putative glucosyltransferase [Roseinatronobacter thiooxidans]